MAFVFNFYQYGDAVNAHPRPRPKTAARPLPALLPPGDWSEPIRRRRRDDPADAGGRRGRSHSPRRRRRRNSRSPMRMRLLHSPRRRRRRNSRSPMRMRLLHLTDPGLIQDQGQNHRLQVCHQEISILLEVFRHRACFFPWAAIVCASTGT